MQTQSNATLVELEAALSSVLFLTLDTCTQNFYPHRLSSPNYLCKYILAGVCVCVYIYGAGVVLWPQKINFHLDPTRTSLLFLYKKPKYWHPSSKKQKSDFSLPNTVFNGYLAPKETKHVRYQIRIQVYTFSLQKGERRLFLRHVNTIRLSQNTLLLILPTKRSFLFSIVLALARKMVCDLSHLIVKVPKRNTTAFSSRGSLLCCQPTKKETLTQLDLSDNTEQPPSVVYVC